MHSFLGIKKGLSQFYNVFQMFLLKINSDKKSSQRTEV